MSEAANLTDRTGPISHAEARDILARFNASHWNDGREKARYTIPADPRRDDDVRLHAYIDQMEALQAEVVRLREALEEWVDYFDMLNRHSDPSDPLVIQRNKYHGSRIAKSRAALSPAKETT